MTTIHALGVTNPHKHKKHVYQKQVRKIKKENKIKRALCLEYLMACSCGTMLCDFLLFPSKACLTALMTTFNKWFF